MNIENGQARVDRELLAQRQLDEGLIPATSEERVEGPEDRERESRSGPHRAGFWSSSDLAGSLNLTSSCD
jgi:hypothetical protein